MKQKGHVGVFVTTNETLVYPNQPLVQVATEIRFDGKLVVEAKRHEFQEKIKDDYPRLMVQAASHGVAPPLQHYRFEKDDNSSGALLAINSFVYYSRNYPGHDIFIKEALAVFGAAIDTIGDIDINRIGWRYINAIPFVREDDLIPLARYFSSESIIGTLVDKPLAMVSLAISSVTDEANINLRMASQKTPSGGEETIVLDTDSFLVGDDSLKLRADDVAGHIHRLHGVGHNLFEDLITDEYRGFLEGGDDA